MSHYRLNDVEPSAIVTVNGSEKKIYDNNQIFLNPDDNFEFRFFNPLQEKVGIEIIFNGLKKDNSLLILNPGEDISLDRFMDDKKKMKYSTYFIDGQNDQAVKAAEKNGLVEINFYKEEQYNSYQHYDMNFSLSGCSDATPGLPHFTNTRSSKGFDGGNQMYSSPGVFTNEIDYSDYIAENTSLGNATLDDLQSTFSVENKNSRMYSADLNTKSFKTTSTKLETGRVEKGEESNQDFQTIDAKFERTAFHTISYELKPQSALKKSQTEVRNYCTSCGYRIRKNTWSFCPKCGEEL